MPNLLRIALVAAVIAVIVTVKGLRASDATSVKAELDDAWARFWFGVPADDPEQLPFALAPPQIVEVGVAIGDSIQRSWTGSSRPPVLSLVLQMFPRLGAVHPTLNQKSTGSSPVGVYE